MHVNTRPVQEPALIRGEAVPSGEDDVTTERRGLKASCVDESL